MLLPSVTGLGEAVLVTLRSDWVAAATVTFAVALLFPVFGSSTPETTPAVSVMIVPFVVPAITVTTTVIVAVFPDGSGGAVVSEQLIVFGVVVVMREQAQPAGPVAETKDVFAGRLSVTEVFGEAAGPLLVTTWV